MANLKNKALGLIAARAGSKGLPGKNTRSLGDKPLVAYTIEAAISSSKAEPFISTDDPLVIAIAKQYNLDTKYERPAKFATDEASMVDVVLDVLTWLEQNNQLPEKFVLLQATSPFRTGEDIDLAIDLLDQHDSVVGASPAINHPFECISVSEKSWTPAVDQNSMPSRRQDFEKDFYFINGAIYAGWTEKFRASKKFLQPTSKILIMDPINSIDIDTPLDFACAEGAQAWHSGG